MVADYEIEVSHGYLGYGHGFVTYFKVPGGFSVQLYELKYSKW